MGRTDDIVGSRFIPPAITRFLNDPRIGPYTRAFLHSVSAKPTPDWTLRELHMVTQIVPTLAETGVPTRVLVDFYRFLGLEPSELFEPHLGKWQTSGVGFDNRNYDAVQRKRRSAALLADAGWM